MGSFWPLPRNSKLDILDESRHSRVLVAALKDSKTAVERIDKDTFAVYGPEEALLIVPVTLSVRIVLIIYAAICAIFH